MKRFIFLLTTIFMCTIARADNVNINWIVGDNTYTTTQCEMGNDLILPTTPTKTGYTFRGWRIANFTPIEYLESTGTQYIDTGVVGDLNTEYEITVTTDEHNFNYAYVVFGSRQNANQNNIYCSYTYNETLQTLTAVQQFGDYRDTNQIVTASNSFIGQKLTFRNSREKRSIYNWENKQTETVNTTYSGSLTTPTNLYIGYAGSIGALGTPSNFTGYLYRCKIWQSDVLVRDFIPVFDGDGVPCMYDLVEGKFYYNAGTGQFIAGPVIWGD